MWTNLVGRNATFLLFSWQSPPRPPHFLQRGPVHQFSNLCVNSRGPTLSQNNWNVPEKTLKVFLRKTEKIPSWDSVPSPSRVFCVYFASLVKPSQLICENVQNRSSTETSDEDECLMCIAIRFWNKKRNFPRKKFSQKPKLPETQVGKFADVLCYQIDDLMSRRSWSALRSPRFCGNHKSPSCFCLFSVKSLLIRKNIAHWNRHDEVSFIIATVKFHPGNWWEFLKKGNDWSYSSSGLMICYDVR